MIVLGCAVAYTIYLANVVDRSSIDNANDRAGEEIVSVYTSDSNTYTSYSGRDLPFFNPTETYPLSYENIANGNLLLSSFFLYHDDDETQGSLGHHLLFENDSVKKCYTQHVSERGGYEYTSCDDSVANKISFLDVVIIPSESNLYGQVSGLVLLELKEENSERVFVAGLYKWDTEMGNVYGLSFVKELQDYPSGALSLNYNEYTIPFSETYYHFFDVRGADGKDSYVFRSLPVKNGPVHDIVKLENGMVITEVKVSDDVAGYNGILHIAHDLKTFWSSRGYSWVDHYTPLPEETQDFFMYHKDSCDQPYAFTDRRISITGASNTEVSMSLSISFARNSEVYYLTTSRYGYDPEKWGTLVATIDRTEYFRTVTEGIPFNGHTTELLNIAGTPVRYTLLHDNPRPCEQSIYELYQWVKDGSLFTLNMYYSQDYSVTEAEREFITNVLETLIKNTRYIPNN